MIWQSLSFAVCVLTFWTIGHATGCGDRQIAINGQCCNLCPPGTYVERFCSDKQQTLCTSCPEGHFSDHYTVFDRCEPCRSCQQEFSEKCTPTTDATCSCRSGFLCSNSICSICEENKCVMGEKLNRTEISSHAGVTKYSYHCEPLCPKNAYFDATRNSCETIIRCSVLGFAERFPGNKTHPPVCDKPADAHSDSSPHLILGIGFVSLSVSLLLFLSYICMKNQRKHAESKNPVLAVSTNTSEFHLSKEESGHQLISQTESKDSNSLDQVHLEKVISL
ncbi:tumor necrosis factor receptor superfamily member 3-like [Acanthochromis polyacanthus]|uniref:tumor necrosis factor receptor superfamily member 3-like n=1 Tax=Acanthochromis polyacanthus TaxID=80966 RepID=UPI002234CE59|nr:tumor necrosis factor receptor superfamily member 3-like [Acanthochromis polyacanthus]